MKDILYFNTLEDIKMPAMMRVYKNNKLKHDYSQDYLTFEALEDGTFTFRFQGMYVNDSYFGTFSYSLDNGNTWSSHNISEEYYALDIPDDDDTFSLYITTPTVLTGEKLLIKGYNDSFYLDVNTITSTCRFNVSGNIHTLMRGEDNPDPEMYLRDCTYRQIFKGCTTLVSAENLYLPPLTDGSPNSIYSSLFSDCTALTIPPVLSSTILVESCYSNMFSYCTSLTTAPKLPATTLARSCYSSMFMYCTSLTEAPELPAITLVNGCYSYMFNNCSKLNYIKAMFTTTPTSTYTNQWVTNVAKTGKFVKNVNAEWTTTGTYGIPTTWSVETIVPQYDQADPKD